MVHQKMPHQLGRNAKKVRPVLPQRWRLLNQTKIGLVHKRGTLQRVIGALAAKMSAGDTPQLVVNERNPSRL